MRYYDTRHPPCSRVCCYKKQNWKAYDKKACESGAKKIGDFTAEMMTTCAKCEVDNRVGGMDFKFIMTVPQ